MNAVPLRRPAEQAPDEKPVSAGVVPRRLPPVPDLNVPGYQPQIPAFVTSLPERLAALSGTSLLHASPPSVAAVWSRHREAAQRFDAGLVRWPRHMWGVLHTAATGTAYLLIAVAFSPAGFALAVIILAACWLWL